MSQPLSSRQIDSLLPALRHLAEMVRDHGSVERTALRLLVVGCGLDSAIAANEVEVWTQILEMVAGDASAQQQEMARRALMVRGIADAPATLAVAVVTQRSKPQRAQTYDPIRVEPSRLDFGLLEYGETKRLSLTVTGGPGRVELGSDRIAASTEVFGPEETEVRIGVDPSVEGVLYTNVRFVTDETALEVPVIAQWLAQDPPGNKPGPERYVPIYLLVAVASPTDPILPQLISDFRHSLEDEFYGVASVWATPVGYPPGPLATCKDRWRPFCWPRLRYGGNRRLDLALGSVCNHIEADLAQCGRYPRHYQPHVFVVLQGEPEGPGGEPDEIWKAGYQRLRGFRGNHHVRIFWFVANQDIGRKLQREIGEHDVILLLSYLHEADRLITMPSIEVTANDQALPFDAPIDWKIP